MNRHARRGGFTLIEMLVVFTIIALLAALLVPAVQAGREAARRAQCANNLKQIGLALQQHSANKGSFPTGIRMNSISFQPSYLVSLLPYMEQKPLYDSINFSFNPPMGVPVSDPNDTVLLTQLNVLLCPTESNWQSKTSDAISYQRPTNYAANCGNDNYAGNGIFTAKSMSPRDITDGLSHTAGLSEWIIGDGSEYTVNQGPNPQGDRLGSLWLLNLKIANKDYEGFARVCSKLETSQISLSKGYKGSPWMNGGFGITQYNHTMTPNQPSCLSQGEMTDGSEPSGITAVTAGSRHNGGAHTLLMDGGVRFVKDSISRQIWSALGTRSGREVVEDF